MDKRSYWLLTLGYSTVILGLFFYSFTQVDLNLSLSRVSLIQSFQKFFIQIGYFNRPASTAIFLFLVFLLFAFYFLNLWLTAKKRLEKKQIWWLIILAGVLLLFSYPAFSYDIFNYMFDAKTLVDYRVSPYSVRPLDFPADPWLRFMHWVHRPSVYPQVWLTLTTIPYIFGFGKFLLILYNFKLLMTLAHLGTAYFIYKILKKTNPAKALLGVVFFALNPLILIENLVSAHQDIVMMFFALWATYLLIRGKRLAFLFLLALSVQMKYVSLFLLPLLVLGWRKILAIGLMVLAILAVVVRIEVQPWYLVWLIPLVALSVENKFLTFLTIGASLALLLRYTPFIYLGHWDPPAPQLKVWLTAVPILAAIFIFLLYRLWKKNSA